MSSSPLKQPTDADAEEIAELFRVAFGDARPIDADEVRSWFANEEMSPEHRRILEVDGRIVGYADIWPEDTNLQIDAAAPGHWDVFFEWAEEHALKAGIPQMRAYFNEGHELERVVEARGYHYWRSSFTMRVEFDARPDTPELPAGIKLRTYRDGDAEPLRAALNEAFVEDPFWHTITPASLREFYLRRRGFDPSLWLLAWDGDALAGFAITFPERPGDKDLGWVATLGVRAPWRRRGLGEALLRTAFGVLYDRGLRQIGLGVDAENPTGALRLYERAGMRALTRNDNWALDL
jgi:mycothiol synthase